MLWHGLSGARVFTELGLAGTARQSRETQQLLGQTSLCPALGAVPLCLSQLVTVPSLSCSHPVVELLLRAGRALVVTLCVLGWGSELWWGGCRQRSGWLLGRCLSKCQQWPLPPHPGSTPRLSHLCIPWSSLFSGRGYPRSNWSAVAWNEWDGSIARFFRLRCMASWSWENQPPQSRSLSALPRGQPTCMHSSQVESSLVCLAVLQPAEGPCLLHKEPQLWDTQSVAQPDHSPGWVSTHATSLFL